MNKETFYITTPTECVDGMAKYAKKIGELMNIEYDDFIRTTEKRHVKMKNE